MFYVARLSVQLDDYCRPPTLVAVHHLNFVCWLLLPVSSCYAVVGSRSDVWQYGTGQRTGRPWLENEANLLTQSVFIGGGALTTLFYYPPSRWTELDRFPNWFIQSDWNRSYMFTLLFRNTTTTILLMTTRSTTFRLLISISKHCREMASIII